MATKISEMTSASAWGANTLIEIADPDASAPKSRKVLLSLVERSAANPSATLGLAAVNGSAATFMRSDAAPALSQAIAPTWSALHTFSAGLTVSGGSLTLSAAGTPGAGKVLTSDGSGVATWATKTRTGIVREVWFPASDMYVGSVAGTGLAAAGVMSGGLSKHILTFDFDDTVNEYVQFTWSPPLAWNRGSFKLKVYWTAVSGTASQDVIWNVSWKKYVDGDTLGGASVGGVVITDTYQASGLLHIATSVAGGSGASTDDNLIHFLVNRSATSAGDTKTGDALLIGVKLQYTEDSTEPSAW